jgi:hypothetical protein
MPAAEIHSLNFTLEPGNIFRLLGDRKVLFAQRQQKVFGLNDVAAYLVCRLADGTTIAELGSALAERGIAAEAAGRFIRHLFLTLSSHRLLRARPPASAKTVVYEQNLEVAGVAARLCYHDASLVTRLAPVFAHLESGTGKLATRHDLFRVEDFVLIRSGDDEGEALVFAAAQAAPAIKGLLTDAILSNADEAVVMHSACLEAGGGGLLLMGAPGAGKTTLTFGLLHRGFRYGGDDIARLDPNGLVEGAPFALALKSGSWRLAEALAPGITAQPIHRRLDRKRVRYFSPERELIAGPLAPRWVVLLRRRKDGPARLNRVEPAMILSEIISGASSSNQQLSAQQFATLSRFLNTAGLYVMHYSRLDGAVDALTRLCTVE